MLTGKSTHLLDFGQRDIPWKHATDAAALMVDLQHHVGGLLQAHRLELLQNLHHEVHRREIIVQQEHLVQRGRLQGQLLPFKDDRRIIG